MLNSDNPKVKEAFRMLKESSTRFFTLIPLFVIVFFLTACPAATPAVESESVAIAPLVAEADSEATAPIEEEQSTVADASAAAGATTFAIVPEETEARFSIYELLMGQDKTVIGATRAVEGAITVDPADPRAVIISPIRIDASTLTTDSSRRDGAIRRWVLETNQADYQYILFTPIALDGVPERITVGDTFEFTVTGNLTIRDITNEETFTLAVTVISETELSGLGKTTLMRSDYELTIPSVPSVANVAEEVPVEIEFRAVANE